MGFTPTRADPDLWIKPSSAHSSYDYIGTFVNDLIIVAQQPLTYLETLVSRFNLRNITDLPKFFLSTNWTNMSDNSRISNKTCIKEYMRKY